GGRATEEALAGLEHLTIELDVAAAMQAHDDGKASGGLEHLTLASGAFALPEPATPTAQPPAVPEASTPPPHLTIEIDPPSMATELPPGTLDEIASESPLFAPETATIQDISLSLSLDISSLDLASMTSATDPAERLERIQSVDAEPPESTATTMFTQELRDA